MRSQCLLGLLALALATACAGAPSSAPPPPPPPTQSASKAMEAPPSPITQAFGDKNFVLHSDLGYQIGVSRDSIVVPAGFVTDLASVPAPFIGWLHPNGAHALGAIIHDYLYWNQSCTRAEADGLMRLALMETRVPDADRAAIYRAVRAGGAASWQSNAAERASGLPRIIPQEYRSVPPLTSWREYRVQLRDYGIAASPGVTVSSSACARGAQSVQEALTTP